MTDGWFRTGDRGTIDELGRIWLAGRIKDEINCAGFKVQPAEIDGLLERHPEIAEACAFAIPDPISGESIGVAIKFTPGANPSIKCLRSWCRERMRRRAVPNRWFIVDHIPATLAAKSVAMHSLECFFGANKSPRNIRDSVVAESEGHCRLTEVHSDNSLAICIHRAVKRAWTTILDEQSFQADTQWQEAGANSLDALRLLHIIERELNTQLPLETLTQSITPTKLASAIEILLKSNKAEAHDADQQLPLVFFFPHAHGDTPSLAEFRSIMKDRIRFVVIRYPQLTDMVRGGGTFDLLVDTRGTDSCTMWRKTVPFGRHLVWRLRCVGNSAPTDVRRTPDWFSRPSRFAVG